MTQSNAEKGLSEKNLRVKVIVYMRFKSCSLEHTIIRTSKVYKLRLLSLFFMENLLSADCFASVFSNMIKNYFTSIKKLPMKGSIYGS